MTPEVGFWAAGGNWAGGRGADETFPGVDLTVAGTGKKERFGAERPLVRMP